jgi:hypothetical protein
MKNLSRFDLGMIIAFVVVALLGGGAWWYLSGQLQAAQAETRDAKTSFDRYSVAKGGADTIVVSPTNGKTLQTNIDLLKTQLTPLIQEKLQSKENTLHTIDKEDPVAWKHDLEDDIRRLTSTAKTHGVALPTNFAFGFSRYVGTNPADEQTAVLSKQLLGIDKIATILIMAPVKGIQDIRRTYEEDPHTSTTASNATPSRETTQGPLPGYALSAPGNAYIAYPFEIDFETNAENFRTVIDGLIQSPYVFVIRAVTVKNSSPTSPLVTDLERLAGGGPGSVIGTSPGEVAQTQSTKGPQYLFGNSTLSVKLLVDMIEWNAGDLTAPSTPTPSTALTPGAPKLRSPTSGGIR